MLRLPRKATLWVELFMQRDMDLVRQILLFMEQHEHGSAPKIEISNYTPEQIGFHIWLMIDGGLIDGIETTTHGDPSPVAIPLRIKWAGYEFLATAKDNATWRKVMNTVLAKAGGTAFEVLKAALLSEAKRNLGL